MAMIDEWGEAINNISDEGVFDDTSLGDNEVPAQAPEGGQVNQFPEVNTTSFPYAPEPVRQIHQVSPNRFGLYQGGGPQVRAEFPGQPIHSAMSQAMRGLEGRRGMGMRGMGDDLDDLINSLTGGDSAPDYDMLANTGGIPGSTGAGGGDSWDSWDTRERADFITGVVDEAADLGMNIANFAVQMQQSAEVHDARMQAFTQQVENQNRLFTARLAQMQNNPQQQSRVAELQRQLNAALQQVDQNPSQANLEQLMRLMSTAEQVAPPPRPVWPWILGGVAALGLGVLGIYFLTREK